MKLLLYYRITLDFQCKSLKGERAIENLRDLIRVAKALDSDITYKELASIIDITPGAFYNYLKGYYELSYSKKKVLKEYLEDIICIDKILL